jgi:Tol biopolymer transport system component/tRNA A-37 threonylcarbamoyl transferase component Bud32
VTDVVARLTTALADRYVIERELGAGGMATVFLAHDVRHERRVAVKVLRAELSAIIGGERFLNEIRVTANLQHPHILALYDSGSAAGLLFYVMPYIEGETLRERLDREKQIGVEQAVEITQAVAAALGYAHRHGVVHRDIKPENILLHDGQPVVADFGIALAVSNAGGSRLTETGLSLGTPNYMSPEQATGDRAVDGRSDIYSLACVAYEMLTGDPPHTGSTAQAVIAKIITEQPRLVTSARPATPAHVTAALHRALAKLPADRFETAAEFADALGRPGSPATIPSFAAPLTRGRAPRLLLGGVAAVALAVGYAAARLTRPAPVAGQVGRFGIQIEPYANLGSGFAPGVTISSDGSKIAFVGRGTRGNQVYLRALDDSIPRPVAGTELAFAPIFTHDGRDLYFWTNQQRISRVPVEGGTPIEIVTNAGSAVTLLRNGTLVYVDQRQRAIMAYSDGATRTVVSSDTASFVSLTSLPGDRAVLAGMLSGGRNRSSIVSVSLSDGSLRDAGLPDVLKARYLPSGHVVYQRRVGGVLLAAPFSLRSLRVTGEGRPVAPPARITFRVIPQWDVSDNGTIAYLGVAPFELVEVTRSGQARVLQGEPRSYHHPRYSPDGRRVALDITEGDARDLWLIDVRDRTLTRLTVGEVANDPYWSPDGRRLGYTALAGTFRGVFTRASDGSGHPDTLLVNDNDHSGGVWSPDGRVIATATGLIDGIWAIPAGGGEPFRVAGSRSYEAFPGFSRDGRWMSYVSGESGRQEVYVRPFPGPGGRVQVSVDGGSEPVWSRDGRELYYREDSGTGSRLIAAQVRTSPSFEVTGRTPLFDMSAYVVAEDHANFDVGLDGRFVLVRSPQASQVGVVLNALAPRLGGRTR